MHPDKFFICAACRLPASDNVKSAVASPGEALVARLRNKLSSGELVQIEPVDCLAVCDRPCAIAFSARDKWTYLIGDINPEVDAEDILLAPIRIATSGQPVLALAERPPFFRSGIIGKIPPP